MKKSLYFTVARESIKKNRRIFAPYFLSGILLTSITYILFFLHSSGILEHIEGGSVLRFLLPVGIVVMGVFSLIFMFYCNSFTIRQRYSELGLYNVLGMDKKNLSKILFWENAISYTVSVSAGLIVGISLSKFAELGMVNLLHEEISYEFNIDFISGVKTASIFGLIFLILLFNSLKKIKNFSAIQLLKSTNIAEKEPKANYIAAVFGIIILAIAYFIALSIKNPLATILWFIVAVIMVIVASYMIFISGSVALCKFLRKRKNYYYKANHFVSVSTMTYRMKRNGAGLASICILITIVLVMLSTATCLYSSAEDSLNETYTQDMSIMFGIPNMDSYNKDSFNLIGERVKGKVKDCKNVTEFNSVRLAGLIDNGFFNYEQNSSIYSNMSYLEQLCYVNMISLEDYNRITGKNLLLNDYECFVFTTRTDITFDTFEVLNCSKLKVAGTVDKIPLPTQIMKETVPIINIIVNDVMSYLNPITDVYNSFGFPITEPSYYFSFDSDLSQAAQVELRNQLISEMDELAIRDADGGYSYSVDSKANARSTFYGLYGSLFFIGIILSIVFIFATILIMYYKQIAEGFEDRNKFEIMQKVGMTDKEIKKTINSQVLTVFFLPLLLAGCHLTAAFPIIKKMLMLLMFDNTMLMILITVATFAVFAVVYALVYKMTSNTYYRIVKKRSA